ncbi:hypothetical protein ElyMa_000255500 [Elysia marginata]|uniref:Uncharacterized protein n=1 Tax=Elysia marginata TaxID=1093978 RepID=A0AAV4F475_9GAST|nr:hypothetical protein ElyMa_000255500 [Elysia marginata]
MAYGLYVKNDNEDIHSKFICKPCQGRISIIKRTGLSESIIEANNQMMLQSQKLWAPFNANFTISQCSVCKHCSELSKGGRPKKHSRHGRKTIQNKEFTNTDFNIYSDTNVSAATTETNNLPLPEEQGTSNANAVSLPEASGTTTKVTLALPEDQLLEAQGESDIHVVSPSESQTESATIDEHINTS